MEKHERTEAGDRPGLDDVDQYRGIARHPLARRWLRSVYAEAKRQGNAARASKTRRLMVRLGMEVRA